MTSEPTLSEQWQELCGQHEAARAAYLAAFSVVNAKFAAVGKGTSHTNPTAGELGAFEATWKSWQEVKDQMDAFVKKHA